MLTLALIPSRSLYDGYSGREQFRRTYDSYFRRNSKEGLRDLVAQGIGMFAVFRNGNQRRIDLPEMSHRAFPDTEGTTPCFAAVITTREGKTNPHGTVQYAAFMRSEDVLVCPVVALSIYVFCHQAEPRSTCA